MSGKYFKSDKISKRYTDRVGYNINLLKEISFSIEDNNFTTLLAPVGSGKTSLLKILAGLDLQTSGVIETNCNKRIFIPSQPSSFPWLSVSENIRLNSNYNKEEIFEIIDLVGLHGYEDHFPHNKSEGFRFRISLGRAIANKPDIIFIDEPFNNLNTSTRQEIYYLMRSIFIQKSIPIIFGTTNITEAIYLSDKIYLMKKNPGEIVDEVNIKLTDKREIDIMNGKEFISIRTEIENTFKDRIDRQLYNFSI